MIGKSLRGEYRDILIGPGGRIVYDSNWQHNVIVSDCYVLLAALMKGFPDNANNNPSGICHLTVGQGSAVWDGPGPDEPGPEDTLVTPHYPPLENFEVVFLGSMNDAPTNRLLVIAKLEKGYPPSLPNKTAYPLREFGLFGRWGDKKYMINCVRHPCIEKAPDQILHRRIRFDF